MIGGNLIVSEAVSVLGAINSNAEHLSVFGAVIYALQRGTPPGLRRRDLRTATYRCGA